VISIEATVPTLGEEKAAFVEGQVEFGGRLIAILNAPRIINAVKREEGHVD
jgi:hypothetical protein